jgi:hypothetical protein
LQVKTGWRKFMWSFFREGHAEMTFAANSIRKSALAPENGVEELWAESSGRGVW